MLVIAADTRQQREAERQVTRLVVIGGGAAGMSAASAARRVAPGLDVVVCEAGGFAAYGMCGIPYFLGGTVRRAESLLAYPPEEFRDRRGIDLRLFTRVTGIDPATRRVRVGRQDLGYDALIVASGADPVRPPVPGLGHDRVFTVRSLDEAIRLRRLLDGGAVRRAVVVGAGYIGLETAEALVCAGADVEVIEALPRVLGTVDEPVADLVAAELTRHVRLRLGARLEAVLSRDGGLTAVVDGTALDADLLIVATGIRPATGLAAQAGARCLPDGSVLVDACMRTSLPGIFAVGDCVALPHLVLGGPVATESARPPAWRPRLERDACRTGRCWSTRACVRRCRAYSRWVTAWRCRTWCSAGLPGCR